MPGYVPILTITENNETKILASGMKYEERGKVIIFENTEQVIKNLQALCLGVLQPVRDYFQRPMIISSGFRCQELNSRINGSPNSQHVLGQAADIEVLEVGNLELSDWIHHNLSYLHFYYMCHIHFDL